MIQACRVNAIHRPCSRRAPGFHGPRAVVNGARYTDWVERQEVLMGAPDLSNEPSPAERLAAIEASIEALRAEVLELRAKLVPAKKGRDDSVFAIAPGALVYMADDFDAPLEDFAEYM